LKIWGDETNSNNNNPPIHENKIKKIKIKTEKRLFAGGFKSGPVFPIEFLDLL
jgi:hypothetical protein